jgi:hypothetical protein
MPKPTTKSRQDLRARFVRNAIPTEEDFADLIAASLNQADDSVLKLPDQPLSLVRQTPDQPVLRFYEDPKGELAAWQWQVQLSAGNKAGFGLVKGDGKLSLFLDGVTGNVGIGTANPDRQLTIANVPAGQDRASHLTSQGTVAIKGICPQLDFIDIDHKDWSIYVDAGRLHFIREPWEASDLVLDGTGRVGIGTANPIGKLHIQEPTGSQASAKTGSLLLDHEDPGGASSIVFRSKVNRPTDHAFIEFKDKNPGLPSPEAALLTIGIQNDENDHIALMPSGNVGINIARPEYKLDVKGSAGIRDELLLLADSNPIKFTDKWSGFPDGRTNGAEISNDVQSFKTLMIVGNNSAGEGRRVSVWDVLDVNGTFRVNGGGNQFSMNTKDDRVVFKLKKAYHGNDRQIYWDGDNNWDQVSDESLKTDVEKEVDILSRLSQVEVKTFRWIGDLPSGKKRLGFIAQDVLKVFPDLVKETAHDDRKVLSLNYTNFGILAIGAINELSAKVDQEMAEMRAGIDDLRARLAALSQE